MYKHNIAILYYTITLHLLYSIEYLSYTYIYMVRCMTRWMDGCCMFHSPCRWLMHSLTASRRRYFAGSA